MGRVALPSAVVIVRAVPPLAVVDISTFFLMGRVALPLAVVGISTFFLMGRVALLLAVVDISTCLFFDGTAFGGCGCFYNYLAHVDFHTGGILPLYFIHIDPVTSFPCTSSPANFKSTGFARVPMVVIGLTALRTFQTSI
jgi:hypothetical protein